MSEQPTPNPGEEPEKKKGRSPRADVPRAYLDELTMAGEVATAAAKPAYVPKLLEEGMEETQVQSLLDLIESAREQCAEVGGKKTQKKTVTQSESKLRAALLVQVDKLQSRVKRAYTERTDPQRADYYIGKPMGESRPQIEQATAAMIKRATADAKLKASPALLANLTAAREAYLGVQGEQTSKTTDAKEGRESLEEMIQAVATARRNIQYAADAAWPAREKIHGAIRTEFKIPPTRPLP